MPGLQSVIASVHGVRSAENQIWVTKGKVYESCPGDYAGSRPGKIRIPVIADGGLTEIGDICKALGAGADFIMSGRFFAACDEAPNGTIYRGSASQDVQALYRNDKQMPTPEGKTTVLGAAGPVRGVVDDIAGGIRSAFSYVGARDMKEYHEKCQFGTRK